MPSAQVSDSTQPHTAGEAMSRLDEADLRAQTPFSSSATGSCFEDNGELERKKRERDAPCWQCRAHRRPPPGERTPSSGRRGCRWGGRGVSVVPFVADIRGPGGRSSTTVASSAQREQDAPDQGVDLERLDVVQLLDRLLDLALVRLDVDDEDERVVLLDLLHGRLGVERVHDRAVRVHARQRRDRLALVLGRTGEGEGLGAAERCIDEGGSGGVGWARRGGGRGEAVREEGRVGASRRRRRSRRRGECRIGA